MVGMKIKDKIFTIEEDKTKRNMGSVISLLEEI